MPTPRVGSFGPFAAVDGCRPLARHRVVATSARRSRTSKSARFRARSRLALTHPGATNAVRALAAERRWTALRLRSALMHLQARSLSVLPAALPASPLRDERSRGLSRLGGGTWAGAWARSAGALSSP